MEGYKSKEIRGNIKTKGTKLWSMRKEENESGDRKGLRGLWGFTVPGDYVQCKLSNEIFICPKVSMGTTPPEH